MSGLNPHPTPYSSRLLVLVPEAKQAAANAALEALGLGPETFRVPVGPPSGAITHYAAEMQLTPKLRDAVRAALPAGAKVTERDHWDPARGKPSAREALAAEGVGKRSAAPGRSTGPGGAPGGNPQPERPGK